MDTTKSYRLQETAAFSRWFKKLRDLQARAAIALRLRHVAAGHLGDVKSVGGGVFELRWHLGPDYRVNFATGVTGSCCCWLAVTNRRRHVTSAGHSNWPRSWKMVKTRDFDVAHYPDSEEMIGEYLNRALGVRMQAHPLAH